MPMPNCPAAPEIISEIHRGEQRALSGGRQWRMDATRRSSETLAEKISRTPPTENVDSVFCAQLEKPPVHYSALRDVEVPRRSQTGVVTRMQLLRNTIQ
jgi:hypothetical protein